MQYVLVGDKSSLQTQDPKMETGVLVRHWGNWGGMRACRQMARWRMEMSCNISQLGLERSTGLGSSLLLFVSIRRGDDAHMNTVS